MQWFENFRCTSAKEGPFFKSPLVLVVSVVNEVSVYTYCTTSQDKCPFVCWLASSWKVEQAACRKAVTATRSEFKTSSMLPSNLTPIQYDAFGSYCSTWRMLTGTASRRLSVTSTSSVSLAAIGSTSLQTARINYFSAAAPRFNGAALLELAGSFWFQGEEDAARGENQARCCWKKTPSAQPTSVNPARGDKSKALLNLALTQN